MKTMSWRWVFVMGLLAVVAQIVIFYARFGRWNTDSAFIDYLLFFLAGALGGGILTFILNRQTSGAARRAVWIAFLLASPFALLMMIAGGVLGPLGVLILSQIPWVLFMWVGSWVGSRFTRSQLGT